MAAGRRGTQRSVGVPGRPGMASRRRARRTGDDDRRAGGFLDGAADFDAGFFGVSEREAGAMVSQVARFRVPLRCSATTRIIASLLMNHKELVAFLVPVVACVVHMTRASSRSFRTSSLAATAGDPSINGVSVAVSGT